LYNSCILIWSGCMFHKSQVRLLFLSRNYFRCRQYKFYWKCTIYN
jgi:hypothetical protein